MSSARPVPLGDAASAPYWDALRRREFVLPWDNGTGEFVSPMRATRMQDIEWRTAPRRGTLVSYSFIHLPFGEDSDELLPYCLATVRIDNGPQLMTNLVDIGDTEVRVGLEVELAFEERDDDWVVPQFTPRPPRN